MLSSFMRSNMLAYVRKQLTETCLIEKPESATNRIGGGSPTWVTVAADAPCRTIRNLRGQAEELGDQPSDKWDMTLITLPDQELEIGYRITIGGDVLFVTAIRGHLSEAVDRQATLSKKR